MLINNSQAAENIMFYVHGGAIISYKSDKIEISPANRVKLTTLAPTFAEYPNIIGEFSYMLSNDDYKKLNDNLSKQIKRISNSQKQADAGALVEELNVGNEKRSWASDVSTPAVNEIRKMFLAIAKEAYANPVKALKLECSQKGAKITCTYANVGKETVETVNPLGVNYSIQCLDITNKKTILYKEGTHDPHEMKPEKIKISPSQKYSFSINTSETCDYRIIVKTTDLMINSNYKDVLLGELVSDVLPE